MFLNEQKESNQEDRGIPGKRDKNVKLPVMPRAY
jgi:hypothetical protein